MTIKSFRDLRVWQESHSLALEIYSLTGHFPTEEKFGLTSQMRRASHSIPANIAEGMGRETRKDFLNFLSISRGSTQEMINFCLFATELGFIEKNEGEKLVTRYGGLSAGLQCLITSLENRPNKRRSTTKQLNNS